MCECSFPGHLDVSCLVLGAPGGGTHGRVFQRRVCFWRADLDKMVGHAQSWAGLCSAWRDCHRE